VIRSARHRGGRNSIIVALAANVIVASAKLAAGLVTGSSALIAEAFHSSADSINEIMLAFSLRSARRPPDLRHPFGYGRARFLWAFVASISSFLLGGCLSILLAVRDLVNGAHVQRLAVAAVVLLVAAVADGTSLAQTLRHARRDAREWRRSTKDYLRYTSDPTLRALAVEDVAALIGVAIAATGLAVSALGGPTSADAIASLIIGVVLAATAVGLAQPMAELLIGRSIPPDRLATAHAILEAAPGIAAVRSLYVVYAAPHEAVLAAKARPAGGQSADQLARRLDDLDQRLRAELPEIGEVFIDVTANDPTGHV
jgi:cation diffusion facilitator family transporter